MNNNNIYFVTLLLLFIKLQYISAVSCKDYDLDVPCTDVPKCGSVEKTHYATLKNFVTMTDGTAAQKTKVSICFVERDSLGYAFKVHTIADDIDVFSPYTKCNSQVWVNSDVLEVFMAPTATPFDAPKWYYEMDTSPSNAVWVGHKNNSLGNWSNCNHQDDHCVEGPIECNGLDHFEMFPNLIAKAHNITGTGWGVDLTVPFKMFPPEYQQSKIWRANFYRYDYPKGRDQYELSGWSPTECGSFHVPKRFGVLILEE